MNSYSAMENNHCSACGKDVRVRYGFRTCPECKTEGYLSVKDPGPPPNKDSGGMKPERPISTHAISKIAGYAVEPLTKREQLAFEYSTMMFQDCINNYQKRIINFLDAVEIIPEIAVKFADNMIKELKK